VRGAGLPDNYPTDVIYTTSIAGPEITRIPLPSRNERHLGGHIDSDWLTPEPMVRVSQIYLEPILFERMASLPNVTIRNGVAVERFEQTDAGVVTSCSDGTTVASRYLVGCDGGRSTIRKAMGVRLTGDDEIGRTRSTLVRCPRIRSLFGDRRPAWMSWIVNDRVRGTVVAIDGHELWLLHRALPPGAADFAALDFDQSIRDLLGVNDITWDVVNHEDWIGRRLVAERFRDRNVFIAGDAAHLWVPFAGYGMNAGIADAVHLAWLLAAVLRGWASESILDAYQAERHPITEQVSRFAIAKVMENAAALGGGAVPPALADLGEEGAALRSMLGPVLYEINAPQFAPVGLNFGYFYGHSPIIAYDDESPPSYTMGTITHSTAPGCRMPHFTVGGRPILDLLGPDYTLLRFAPDADVTALVVAAEAARLPLRILDVARPAVPDVFTRDLLLVRFDQHVAWRGDVVPDDVSALIRRLRGVA